MRISPWVQVLASGTILALVLERVPLEQLLDAARAADVVWFLPALGATLLMLFVRHVKWYRLLRAAGLPVNPPDSLRSLLCGFALSVLTPGKLGELGRCLFLEKEYRGQVVQLNILERMLDAWAVFTYAVGSLMVVQIKPYGAFALAVWLALLPVVLGLPTLLGTLGEWTSFHSRVGARLRASASVLTRIRTAPFAGLGLLTTSLDLLIFYFLLQGFHRTDFAAALTTFPWMIIAGGLPIAVGGIGPREGVAAWLLAHRAVPAAAAMDAALFVFVLSAVLPALVGGCWMLARRLRHPADRACTLESAA